MKAPPEWCKEWMQCYKSQYCSSVVGYNVESWIRDSARWIFSVYLLRLTEEQENKTHDFPAGTDEVLHHHTGYFSHPLFLLLRADVTSDVCPRDVLRPPHWFAALLTPARLPSACWVLQHLWDERSQLGLNKDKTQVVTQRKDAASLSYTQPAADVYWSDTSSQVLRRS